MSKPFAAVSVNPARFHADMQKVGARVTYGVFFTPRSGSSWLTDMIARTGQLGRPEEWFNPAFVPKAAQFVNAGNLVDYVKMLKRKEAPGRIFGFEITYYQLMATFGDEVRFLALFPPSTPSFFLVREDIILQAVSLAKSVMTSVYHSANAGEEEIRKADEAFEYDAGTIKYWLKHILDQEIQLEQFFARHGIAPMRLSYERMMAAGPAQTLSLFARHLGVTLDRQAVNGGRHNKIGTEKNTAFAARFASEHQDFLRSVAERRSGTLGTLDNVPPRCAAATE